MQVMSKCCWFQVVVALVAVTWTGCAAINERSPFNLVSRRDQSSPNLTTSSPLAPPERSNTASADGSQAQFVSAPTTRPQRRYTAQSCTSGYG